MSGLATIAQSRRARLLSLVVVVGMASVFPFLGSPSLWDFDEAFYAEISRNMAETRDWVVPVFNGNASFDKPPLLYWLTAAWYSVFGPSELGVRVFSAGFLVATCVLTFLIGEHLFSARTGLVAGVILSTSALTMVLGRMGMMDTGLMFFVTAAVYLLLTAGDRATLARYIGAGVLIGLGILIKGPIAAFLAFVCALGAIGPVRFFRRLRSPHLWLTALTGLAVAAPWHVLMWLRLGQEFCARYFGFHQVSLLTDEMMGHGGPFYYYLVVVVIGLLPWSSILVRMRAALKETMVSDERRDAVMCLVRWFAPTFVFFSLISTKAPAYVFPVLPPFCVLLAVSWLPAERSARSEAQRSPMVGAVTAVVSLLALTALMLFRGQVSPQYARAFWFLAVPLFATAAVSVCGLVVSFRSCNRSVYLWTSAIYAAVLVISIGYIAMPMLDEFKPNKPLAEFIRSNLEQDIDVGSMLNGQHDASTVFYMRRSITMLESASEAAQFLAERDNNCLILWDQDIPAVEALAGGRLERLASACGASVATTSLSLNGEPGILND